LRTFKELGVKGIPRYIYSILGIYQSETFKRLENVTEVCIQIGEISKVTDKLEQEYKSA
jgi:hypothetical protein